MIDSHFCAFYEVLCRNVCILCATSSSWVVLLVSITSVYLNDIFDERNKVP